MDPALWIAKTGVDAQQTRMAVISNNLANVNTTGFKRDRAVFEDLLYRNVRQVGAQASQNTTIPTGLSIGSGVRAVATEKIFSQGNLVKTDNNLDVAVQGRGFFQVLMPDGTTGYTRAGGFKLDPTGQLVTPAGNPIQPSITIPNNTLSITISTDGIVSALSSGNTAPTQVGTIQMADFINPGGLQAEGENIFLETVASGSPQTSNPGLNGLGTLTQGYLETSNVSVVEELVNMIETQRAFEMNSKAISTMDEMLQFVGNQIG